MNIENIFLNNGAIMISSDGVESRWILHGDSARLEVAMTCTKSQREQYWTITPSEIDGATHIIKRGQ